MDWLLDQGIVFDILPDDQTVKKVVASNTKIQTLGCLTYLENDPEQENMPLWNIVITLLSAAGGFIVAKIFGTPLAYVLGALGLIFLLRYILKASRKNYHSRHIAAWASSWSTAIKEYSQPELPIRCSHPEYAKDPKPKEENPQRMPRGQSVRFLLWNRFKALKHRLAGQLKLWSDLSSS